MTDVAIIGGGAAGLCTAIMIKELDGNIGVTVFEAADRVLKKLSVTGNGRCNISNSKATIDNFHGDSEFAWNTINNFDFSKQREFFSKLGVLFTVQEDGKAYPKSLQATSVVDALRFSALEKGVNILTETRVSDVLRQSGSFTVCFADKKEDFKLVVIACGGIAGGKMGNDDGYRFLKNFGHKIEKTFPAIVQLKTTTEAVRQLKGIKVNANVTALSDSGTRTEYGEVLFCDYGLSGPPILQVSRLAENGDMRLFLDICPDMTQNEIENEIARRTVIFKDRQICELLVGFINKRLGQVVLKSCGLDLNKKCGNMGENEIKVVADRIKKWQFIVTGTTGFENAQVTAGGAQPTQFFENCMSKKAKGLFAVGEVLGVDGDCGGYNLSFAWASSYAAANGVFSFLNEQGK